MRRLVLSLVLALSTPFWGAAANAQPSHAIAMHGEPALPADFGHLPYANPDAPKGGRINYAWPGTFDSINPFIVQGSGARGSLDLVFGNNVFETLMMRSADEPFTLYPLLAKTIETDDAAQLRRIHAGRAREILGRRAGEARGRHLHFRASRARRAYPRYGVTAGKIAKVEKVGERGRALHLQAARPRTAADPRPVSRSCPNTPSTPRRSTSRR